MLSKRMVSLLVAPEYTTYSNWNFWRDGRTVRALQARGLIKAVSWQQNVKRWRYKFTKKGVKVARNLKFVDAYVIKEIF